MLHLADVLIREEEVLSVAWRGDRLRLVLRWQLEEIPNLLDLPREATLSWHGEEDPEAGIPLRLDGWHYERQQVRLSLRRVC